MTQYTQLIFPITESIVYMSINSLSLLSFISIYFSLQYQFYGLMYSDCNFQYFSQEECFQYCWFMCDELAIKQMSFPFPVMYQGKYSKYLLFHFLSQRSLLRSTVSFRLYIFHLKIIDIPIVASLDKIKQDHMFHIQTKIILVGIDKKNIV